MPRTGPKSNKKAPLPRRYTLSELEAMPTISQGHTDNLKIETEIEGVKYRIWLSRMTVEDGMPYNNQVTVEKLNPAPGNWETVEEYQAPKNRR